MSHINEKKVSSIFDEIKTEISKVLVGQDAMVERLLMAIAVQGHVLIEGMPGLAKTLTVHLLGKILKTSVSRIQFTPDLLPSDITGTMIYNQKTGDFKQHKGPVFANLIIADEINRAPAKVQSALLQAMEEKTVTLGNNVIALPNPFIVIATQNPIEHEGTFELPEAQLDRFLFKLNVNYPSVDDEIMILHRVDSLSDADVERKFDLQNILYIGEIAKKVTVDDSIKKYIINIINSTRNDNMSFKIYEGYIEYGASPRASIAILKCARVQALLHKRDYVIPDDVKNVALDILRHRIILSFDVIGNGIKVDNVIKNILDNVTIPK